MCVIQSQNAKWFGEVERCRGRPAQIGSISNRHMHHRRLKKIIDSKFVELDVLGTQHRFFSMHKHKKQCNSQLFIDDKQQMITKHDGENVNQLIFESLI